MGKAGHRASVPRLSQGLSPGNLYGKVSADFWSERVRGVVKTFVFRCWRREWDSNPRYGFPYTRFPSVRLQPLGHLSGAGCREARNGARLRRAFSILWPHSMAPRHLQQTRPRGWTNIAICGKPAVAKPGAPAPEESTAAPSAPPIRTEIWHLHSALPRSRRGRVVAVGYGALKVRC